MIIKFDYAEFILQVMMDLKNVFAHQPTFKVLELKNDKGTEYIISWKSNRWYNSKLKTLHGAFLSNAKYFGKKIGIQFNNTTLGIEPKN